MSLATASCSPTSSTTSTSMTESHSCTVVTPNGNDENAKLPPVSSSRTLLTSPHKMGANGAQRDSSKKATGNRSNNSHCTLQSPLATTKGRQRKKNNVKTANEIDVATPMTRRTSSRLRKQEEENTENDTAPPALPPRPPPSSRRRSTSRGMASLKILAQALAESQNVVIVTGAGLSVASGVRPFRGPSGLWSEVIWKRGTRQDFRQDPLGWYNTFWLPHFNSSNKSKSLSAPKPNSGHLALQELQELCPQLWIVTQNIDNLQGGPRVIEAHGRLGLYKCIPSDDSDTDDESDDDSDRLVHLGHRRKHRQLQQYLQQEQKLQQRQPKRLSFDSSSLARRQGSTKRQRRASTPLRRSTRRRRTAIYSSPSSSTDENDDAMECRSIASSDEESSDASSTTSSDSCSKDCNVEKKTKSLVGKKKKKKSLTCKYQLLDSLFVSQLQPVHVAKQLMTCTPKLYEPPLCPNCHRPCPPQALLFDEGYHSHDFYQFREIENLMQQAQVLVFVGTSFAVSLTHVALEHAKSQKLPVFNFNTGDLLEPSARLNVENIVGPSNETLPQLVQAVKDAQMLMHNGMERDF